MEEIKAAGSPDMWVPWHEASHYIANDRDRHGKWKADSPTFAAVVDRIAEYFRMDVKAALQLVPRPGGVETYHHDAAAVKPDKAKTQNCTVAVSFGATRDAAFEHAKTGTTVFFPQATARHTPSDTASAWSGDTAFRRCPRASGKPGGDAPRISIIAWGWVDQDRDDVTAFDNTQQDPADTTNLEMR